MGDDDNSWSIPSLQSVNYGLTPSNPSGVTFGNAPVNTGNYQLGGPLTGDPLGGNPNGGSYNFGNTQYTGDPGLGGMFNKPVIPQLSEEARMSLDNMFNFGNKFGLGLSQPTGQMMRMSSMEPQATNNSLDNLNSAITAPPMPGGEAKEPGWFDKGGALYNYGFRKPGTTKDQFFDSETSQERNTRAGKVTELLGSASQMMPGMGYMNMARGAVGGYNALKAGASIPETAGKFLSGFGGTTGAVGNALTGNYGGAVSKMIPGLGGRVAGLGIDAAQGKDIKNPAFTLGGSMLGNRVAGPVGGFIGSKLGSGLASLYRKKK